MTTLDSKVFPEVRIAKSACHGLGLFAGEDIGWGKPIIEYTGQKIAAREGDRRASFYKGIGYMSIFELAEDIDIDGLIGGNESRFINHSKTPNCVPVRINGSILICAIDRIKRGAELFFDYGFDPAPRKRKKGMRP